MDEDNDRLNGGTVEEEDMEYEEEPETPQAEYGKSIASMVLGIVGFAFYCFPYPAILCGVLGVILGAVSLRKHEPGRGMALTGVILGIVTVIFTILIMGMNFL